MTGKKYDPPLKIDMPFGEALERFAQTKPNEVTRAMAETKEGRVCESDLVGPALRFMMERRNGVITTSDLILELETLFNPTGKDAEIISGRSDTHFSQKVRNLVSHKDHNFIAHGYANYLQDQHALQITDLGKDLLKKLGG